MLCSCCIGSCNNGWHAISLWQEPQAICTLERIGDWRVPAGGNTTHAGRGAEADTLQLKFPRWQREHQLKCFRCLHSSSAADFSCVTKWKLKNMRARIWHLNIPSQTINISPPFPSNIPSPFSSSFSSSSLHPSLSLFSMDEWWYSRGIVEEENFPGDVASSGQIKEHVQTTSH